MQAQQVEVRPTSQLMDELERRRVLQSERNKRWRERRRAKQPPLKGWAADIREVLSTEMGQREFLRTVGAA